jgi:hypothetical protein
MTCIAKIISGSQSGADIAGLFAAKELSIPTGGFIPHGYRSEHVPRSDLYQFNLTETESSAYPPRTRLNVKSSDITLIFGNHTSPGCSLTKKCCTELSKPFLLIPNFDENDMIVCGMYLHQRMVGDITCNVAGNREKSFPGIFDKTKDFCIKLFSKINNLED